MTVVIRKSIGKFGVLLILASSLFLLTSVSMGAEGDAQANMEGEKEKVELNFELTKTDFEYKIENRFDPFVPFYSGEATTGPDEDPNEIVDDETRLTGMQLFEPGQLNLVALMSIQGRYVAMVEDFKGQGYLIREGMKIGRRGTVRQIVANKVLIEEIAKTRAGKELRSEIEMVLRKEGEE